MCQLLSGFYHEKRGVLCREFVPSHNDQASLHGIEDELKKAPEIQRVVKWECNPPVKLKGFWDSQNWIFHIGQDIVPDWCDSAFIETEVKAYVQGLLDGCPDTRYATLPILDGRHLAIRGDGEITKCGYSTILFLPDETTIQNAEYVTIGNAGYAMIGNAEYVTIGNAGHATIRYAGYAAIGHAGYVMIGHAGHATIRYAGHATIRYAGYATIQNAEHAIIQYAEHAIIQYAEDATIQYAEYVTIGNAGYAAIGHAADAAIGHAADATIDCVRYRAGTPISQKRGE